MKSASKTSFYPAARRVIATGFTGGSVEGFFMPIMNTSTEKPWNISHLKPDKGSPESIKSMALKCQRAHSSPRGSSKFIGVSWKARERRWIVQIREPGKRTQTRVGSFECELKAAEAYNIAAVAIHGNEAFLNVIPQSEKP